LCAWCEDSRHAPRSSTATDGEEASIDFGRSCHMRIYITVTIVVVVTICICICI
jgi:hypothetical protein